MSRGKVLMVQRQGHLCPYPYPYPYPYPPTPFVGYLQSVSGLPLLLLLLSHMSDSPFGLNGVRVLCPVSWSSVVRFCFKVAPATFSISQLKWKTVCNFLHIITHVLFPGIGSPPPSTHHTTLFLLLSTRRAINILN